MSALQGRRGPWSNRFGGAALVTGASSGIGLAFATALASRGVDLVLVARRADALEALAASLRVQHGVRVLVAPQDLSSPTAATELKARVDAAGFSVGLLVNNAGFGLFGPFAEQSPARAAEMVSVNCRVPVELTHVFLPDMLARKQGALLFVASMAAFQPTPLFAVYGATKAFNLQLAEALWAELRGKGVEVLALCPGYVETGFQDVAHSAQMNKLGNVLTAPQVVERALDGLGRTASVIPGFLNWMLSWLSRMTPRSVSARMAMRLTAPKR